MDDTPATQLTELERSIDAGNRKRVLLFAIVPLASFVSVAAALIILAPPAAKRPIAESSMNAPDASRPYVKRITQQWKDSHYKGWEVYIPPGGLFGGDWFDTGIPMVSNKRYYFCWRAGDQQWEVRLNRVAFPITSTADGCHSFPTVCDDTAGTVMVQPEEKFTINVKSQPLGSSEGSTFYVFVADLQTDNHVYLYSDARTHMPKHAASEQWFQSKAK